MKTIRIRRQLFLFCVGLLALSLLILTLGSPTYGKDPRKTLVVVTTKEEAVTLDPQVSFDGQSPLIWRGVYEPLLNLKRNTFEVIPGLAKRWKVSPDGLVYTLYFQQGVTFHDGTPFTAESVKFTMERSMGLGKAGS